jgi:cell division protein FtsB
MTIIQPPRANIFLNVIIAILITALFSGSFWLVTLYNRLVNLNHNILELTVELNKLQAANAEVKKEIFAILDSQNLERLAGEKRLVKDLSPEYLTISKEQAVAKAGQ